jgi:hypothetical protein
MRKYALAIVALLVLAATGLMNAAATSDEPILATMQADNGNEVNETQAGQLALKSWNTFVENFDYQGEILNRTVGSNLSYDDAMIATVAVFVLNSQALAEAEKINPGDKYADFHNYTINSMYYFNMYLYNMAKLFETSDGKYSRIARDAFNISMDYYTEGKEEAEFIY